MHLINEIGIRKTYADSRYRDRGPLTPGGAEESVREPEQRETNFNHLY